MKIAIVWYTGTPFGACSFRFEEYVRGFEALGHQATVVAPKMSDDGFDVPKLICDNPLTLEQEDFWSEQRFDVAFVPTFHKMWKLLEAIRGAGARVIAVGDSDGQIGIRAHTRASLTRALYVAPGSRGTRIRIAAWFLRRWLRAAKSIDWEDREFLRSTERSDILVLGGEQARANFGRFLRRAGRADLTSRIVVAPHAINRLYVEWPDVALKRRRICAIGRWETPQKDPQLFAAALDRYIRRYDSDGSTEFFLFGPSGHPHFAPLTTCFPQVRYLGPQHPTQIAPQLAESRSLLMSSRWEGCPHAASEALAVGSTLIGPDLPALRDWSAGGRGRVITDRSPSSLAAAIHTEMQAWDRGERDPSQIAASWRPRVSARELCAHLLAELERQPAIATSSDR